jgi:hypothetical protein
LALNLLVGVRQFGLALKMSEHEHIQTTRIATGLLAMYVLKLAGMLIGMLILNSILFTATLILAKAGYISDPAAGENAFLIGAIVVVPSLVLACIIGACFYWGTKSILNQKRVRSSVFIVILVTFLAAVARFNIGLLTSLLFSSLLAIWALLAIVTSYFRQSDR